MATLQRRGDSFRIDFYYGGRRIRRALGTRSQKSADTTLDRVEAGRHRLVLATVRPPEDADSF
jgi:hypothetical protein